MKRCPKCNRTFPDENQKFCTFDGGLLIAQQAFDPNVTIRATAADVEINTTDTPPMAATSRDLPSLPNPNETIAASAPTAVFPRNTGPTGTPTAADIPAPPPPPTQPPTIPIGAITAAPTPPPPVPLGAITHSPQPAKKKSKLPWILAAVLLVLLMIGGGAVALFFVVIKPRLEKVAQPAETPTPVVQVANNNTATENQNENSSVPEKKAEPEKYVPPAGAVGFTNSKDNLDGKLAEHYVDFSFYYPKSWESDPKAGVPGASNFARVFKTLEDTTPESVVVSWYNSNGTYDDDVSIFPSRVEALSAQISKSLPNYRKVSEGPTAVNALKAYDFHFTGVFKDPEKGDQPYWGRAIFIPPGVAGHKNGVTIIMLATSQASDIHNEEDVGVKGDMPMILESFRFGPTR
jgi:hypothetical protein